MQDFDEEVLAVLSCEIGSRPREAPTLVELLPVLGEIRREDGSLVIEFDAAEHSLIEAFVAAERQCCPAIGWDVQSTPEPVLRVSATPAQMDVLTAMFSKDQL